MACYSPSQMLNPRAYRAALLEQLTSAAEAPLNSTTLAGSSESGSERHYRRGAAVDTSASQLRLPRGPSTVPREACVVEDSVVRQGQPSFTSHGGFQHSTVTSLGLNASQQEQQQHQRQVEGSSIAGTSYFPERENDRSLILSFIDNCIRSGVPEETIAEQVQFMVASMKESLALHAALHAQRHKERIREYELGALTNMVERQQLLLDQQHHHQPQQQPSQQPLLASSGYDDLLSLPPPSAPLQLAPPPPLVYASDAQALQRGAGSHPDVARSAPTAVFLPRSYDHLDNHPAAFQRVSPQRRAPSPPQHDSPLSRAGMQRGSGAEASLFSSTGSSPVPISAWQQPTQGAALQKPSVQLTTAPQPSRKAGAFVKNAEGEDSGPRASYSRLSSTRSPSSTTVAREKEKERVSVTAARSSASSSHLKQRHHHDHHSHHRGHRALCDVCLRIADEDAPAAAVRTASTVSPSNGKHRDLRLATARTPPQQRSSPTSQRQRYRPNGHYMKPTHASLVRRASSTSPLPTRSSPATSHAPSRGTSPPTHQPQKVSGAAQRKLVVRSTYSSRLRASASHPQRGSTAASASDASSSNDESGDDLTSRGDEAGSSSSSSSDSGSVSARFEELDTTGIHVVRSKALRKKREGNRPSKTLLDLYSFTPPSASRRPRSTAAAQTDGWAAIPSSTHAWRISIDPEPASTLSSAGDTTGNGRERGDAVNETTRQRKTSSPLPVLTEHASHTVSAPDPRQLQAKGDTLPKQQQRPRRDPPSQPQQQPSAPPVFTVATSEASQSLAPSLGSSPLAATRTAERVSTPPPAAVVPSTVTAVVMKDSDDDEDERPVCVTSPKLQLFIETSQRKVRETERLLSRTPLPSSAPSVASSPARQLQKSVHHLLPQSRWRQQQQESSMSPSISILNRSPSPLHEPHAGRRDPALVGLVDAARETQQQRLRDLHNRLREYDTTSSSRVSSSRDAVRRLGETTFASAWTSSSAQSPDAHWRFEPHSVAPPAAPLDNSPLIQISPTSSDEDDDRV